MTGLVHPPQAYHGGIARAENQAPAGWREEALIAMRSTMPDFPLTLQHFLWRATTLFPKKEIVSRREQGRHRYTYADFGRRVSQLAHALKDLGVERGDRVATLAWNNYRHLELYFAVSCAGSVLHTLNPRLPAEHLEFIINDAEDRVIFVDASLLPVVQRVAKNVKTVRHFVVMSDGQSPNGELTPMASYEDLIAGRPTDYPWPQLDEGEASSMCYTSGTTGKPKGVVYSHRSTYLHSLGIAIGGGIGLQESDVILPVVPMFHANAWGLPYAATMLGAKQVFPDRFLDPVSLTELFREERVTFSSGVPSVWVPLLQHLEKTGTRFEGLRMFVGGSALPGALYDGLTGRGVDTNQGWGMTETSPVAAVATLKSYMPPETKRATRLKAGMPLAGVELRIASVDTGEPVPWDGKSVGEIQVRGPWVTSSYYHGADPDRFTKDGWLRTGDVANVDAEGYAQIVDRTKDLIKSGGEWISSVELESAIMGHPKVLEAAVIGLPHPKWLERPAAFVVPKPDFKGQLTQEEIVKYLEPLVAKWWLPDEVRFVDEIPKTSVGKFDKKVIRAQAAKESAVPAGSE
jgi:fatty-acyl-CoA synthase